MITLMKMTNENMMMIIILMMMIIIIIMTMIFCTQRQKQPWFPNTEVDRTTYQVRLTFVPLENNGFLNQGNK